MEPITIASAFATIVGLLGVFKAEQRAEETTSINQYVEWLRRHQHEQLANLILNNADLSRSLQNLLAVQHDEIMKQLRSLDQVISEVASHITRFKPVTDAMAIQSRISPQAISILQQLNETKASKFGELKTFEGTQYLTWDATPQNVNIKINEPRFAEDDLETLCELGMLRLSYGSKGTRLFSITRAGALVGSNG